MPLRLRRGPPDRHGPFVLFGVPLPKGNPLLRGADALAQPIVLSEKETRMEMIDLLDDMTPEELEPRLELQILTDPLSIPLALARDNNVKCTVKDACNIKLS